MFGVFFSFYALVHFLSPLSRDISVGDTPKSSVSITFDDGPHPTHTDEILDILKEKGVPATFFVIGLHIPRDEAVVQREIREGHIVGGHSYSHRRFSTLTLPEMASEVFLTHLKIFTLTGRWPEYFRFPYGIDDVRIRHFYDGKIIGWNVDAYDWKAKNPTLLAKNIIAQARSGSVILLHDIKGDTVKALPAIIDGVRAKGLDFVLLSELLSSAHSRSEEDILYYSATKTGKLHDHSKSKKIVPTSTEEVLDPLLFTKVGSW